MRLSFESLYLVGALAVPLAELARRSPQMGLTSLAHLMDIDWLREAFRRTRKDGAVGVDGQTWAEYEEHLEANLQTLLDRAKSGTYRAPPVRRAYIPKPGSPGETRPIGIPTLEDKCFDTLDHAHRREFLQLRVRDGVLKRLIGKWLKAGVMEEGNLWYPEAGSPQGGVITPPTILPNFRFCSRLPCREPGFGRSMARALGGSQVARRPSV